MNGVKRPWEDMAAMDSFAASLENHSDPQHGYRKSGSSSTLDARSDEKASAASRQKSCNACVRGKRRCDKQKPHCARCASKGLDCVYQKLPPVPSPAPSPTTAGDAGIVPPSASESATPLGPTSGRCSISAAAAAAASAGNAACADGGIPTITSSTASSSSCVSDVPDFDMGFDIDSLGTDTSPESLQPDVGGPLGSGNGSGVLDFSIVDLMASSAATGHQDIWNMHQFADTANKLDIPPLPTGFSAAMAPSTMLHQQQLQPIRDVSLLRDCETSCEPNCVDIDPLSVHDPTSRLGYTVQFLTNMHKTFSQTRALPFMHPRLWAGQLPKAILAVFSAATAYSTRSSANKAWTIRLLVDAGREIHREAEKASSRLDKLSRVQALLILNSMRIFDGDLGLRAAAEREIPVMLSWVKELKAVRDELEKEEESSCANGFGRDKPPKSWDSWVFLESTRRTLLTSYAVACTLCILKSENPDDMWCDDNNFTASRHLWDATGSVEFYRAWREKPQFLIKNMAFKIFWMYARPDDCDEFTRLMLIPQVGVDAMEHFMNGDVAIPVNPGR